MGSLLLKAQFNLVLTDLLKNQGVHLSSLKVSTASWFFDISVQKNFSSTINMHTNGYIKSLPCPVVILWNNEVRGTCKMNIERALKLRSYILDIDRGKLSLGIFFFLSCLMLIFFHQLSRSIFISVKNPHQKAANLMFCLILPVSKVPWWFLGVQCREPCTM